MDPQSVVFQPQSDNTWRLREELQRLQAIQAEHTDRILRIERRVEDDARMKSVWGGTSPFPGILSGTPQQTPLQQASSEVFKNFDDDSANLIGSLHLDADDEPRRIGANSRANSVRFDESANQGHWSHASRSSMDLIRSSGGVPMGERTLSHKSEGRASSVHSIRSATSGRMNSLNMDSSYAFGDSGRSPVEHALAPGLFLLGSVPAIIRCWMDTNFKHDALYYAAICTGSHKSLIDRRLVEKLGFASRITSANTVVLPVYFPEAVPHPASSRSSSPAPQLPALTVTFSILPPPPSSPPSTSKTIQIIIGSDILRTHSADILFSTNTISLLDDERNKVSIPLVRPEDRRTFEGLYTASDESHMALSLGLHRSEVIEPPISGLGQSNDSSAESVPSLAAGLAITTGKPATPVAAAIEASRLGASYSSDDDLSIPVRRSIRFAHDVDTVTSPRVGLDEAEESPLMNESTTSKSSTPSNWGNWRQREPEIAPKPAAMDYANASKGREAAAPRKESGMRVLRPTKTTSRTTSSSTAGSYQPPQDGRSRFFDEGKRRTTNDTTSPVSTLNDLDSKVGSSQTSSTAGTGAARVNAVNPAGGASAFSWLKPGAPK